MPIYEYKCGNCGHQLEAIQRVNDPPLKGCPACGKRKLKKLVSAAGFQLKGTGWYVTDFRDKDNKKKAKAGGAKEDSKTDSQADSKGDKKKTASASGSSDD